MTAAQTAQLNATIHRLEAQGYRMEPWLIESLGRVLQAEAGRVTT